MYILCGAEKECAAWKIHLQEVGYNGDEDENDDDDDDYLLPSDFPLFQVAFNNNNVLREQQVTHDDIPVIVDKCVKFVYRLDLLGIH